MRKAIAAGVTLLISEGWQVTANADEHRNCDEIELIKGSARAALEVIAVGNQSGSKSFADVLRFNLLTALVEAGSTIHPHNSAHPRWIIASHPDFNGRIMHFFTTSVPIAHISAASISSDESARELMVMADSLQIDPQAWPEHNKLAQGTILPLKLDDDLWERQ
jgi:hypothetical protein